MLLRNLLISAKMCGVLLIPEVSEQEIVKPEIQRGGLHKGQDRRRCAKQAGTIEEKSSFTLGLKDY